MPARILVTGASSGIGRACALHLLAKGHHVLAGVLTEPEARELEGACASLPGRLDTLVFDLTEAEQVARAASEAAELLGEVGLDGLVNVAGIGIGGPVELVELGAWRRQFEVNFFGQLAVIQALLPQLRIARGRIVNMGSIAGTVVSPMQGPYCASKHALRSLTDSLRQELAPQGIWACTVDPGPVRTPIWDRVIVEAEATAAAMPEPQATWYGPMIRGTLRLLYDSRDNGISVDKVVRQVDHALFSRRPRTRYLVGSLAWAAAAGRWLLPPRVFEWALGRSLREP